MSWPEIFAGIGPADALLGTLFMFLASLYRAYTGFGFGLVAVPLLALLLPPAGVVPVVLFLQILATIGPCMRARDHIRWQPIRIYALAALIGVAPGILALKSLDPDRVRLIMGVIAMFAAVQIARGWSLKRPPTNSILAGTGVASGFLGALAGIGGPPLIAVFMASPLPAQTIRTTLAAAFTFIAGYGLIAAGLTGLITADLIGWVLILIPPMLLGTWAGDGLFHTGLKNYYRRIGWTALFAIGSLTALRAGLALQEI